MVRVRMVMYRIRMVVVRARLVIVRARHRMVTVTVVRMVRVGFGLSVALRWTIGAQKADYLKTTLNKS